MLFCNQNDLLIKTHEYLLAPHMSMGGFTGAASIKIQNRNGVN